MDNKISTIIFKHGDDDYSLWIPDLSKEQNDELLKLLEEFSNNGSSIRGSKEEILAEFDETI